MPALPKAEGQMSDSSRRDFIYCIVPYRERPDLLARAIQCFKAQTHYHKVLMIWDTSPNPGLDLTESDRGNIVHIFPENRDGTVGALRNAAIGYAPQGDWDYVAHFDWDDWSAPDRLSIQLAHIQKTGKLVTGFHTMPIYDAVNDKVWIYSNPKPNYALGTSLFYKREAWERVKFPEDRVVDDNLWRSRIGGENIDSISGFREDGSPIMIQVIHGGNASAQIVPSSARFKEATPELAKMVREILARA